MPDLATEIKLGYARGWSFTPLAPGKKFPRLTAWQSAARESLEQALAWAREGNVGLRTGWTSGIAVIDDDTGGAHGLALPETWTVETGGRTADGRPRLQHYYLVYGLVRNYAGTIAEGIDVRGQGGQVVFVGSTHPETGEVYRWAPGLSPMDVPLAEFPVELLPEERDRELYRVAGMVAAGRTHREIAAELGISVGAINRALPPSSAERSALSAERSAQTPERSAPESSHNPNNSAERSALSAERSAQTPERSAPRAPRPAHPDETTLGGRLGEQEQARRLTAYAQSGFRAELARVNAAGEGTRNDTLNQAAFNVGRHVAAGTLDRAEVVAALTEAARAVGLRDGEIRATIESGLRSAERDPCFAPPGGWHERRRPPVVFAGADGETYPSAPAAPEADDKPWILAPGSHVDDQGEYHEVGAFSFAERVLDALPEDLIYRKSGVAGRLRGSPGRREFAILKDNSARLLIDQTARVGVWVKIKGSDGDDTMHLAFKACTKDLGAVLTQHACDSERVRDLDLLVSYPVFLPGWGMAPTGYAKGVYYDPPEELHGLQAIRDTDTIRATLEDLVVDFPFAAPADRENFIGLLLTPIVRPAVEGNTPMHLVLSSLERTGKTKLIEQVFGHTILGTELPSTPLAEQEEERQKAVLSMLLAGDTIVALDNMNESVDSPTLAALLTSRVFAGRLLGQTHMLKLANTITLVGTANNLNLSGELAKRTIPIRLQPTTDHPENRTDFQHPDLLEYLRENRVRVLRCLIGMVLNWIDAGRPRGLRLGGFEAWSESVGGILAQHGWTLWRTNEYAWRQSSDEHGADLLKLVNAWAIDRGGDTLRASTLLELAEAYELFTGILRQSSPRGRLAAFGSKVLRRHVDTPVGGFYIRRDGNAAQNWYRLERADGRRG